MFAKEIVARFHDQAAADKALADFEARFKQGALPEDIPEFQVSAGGETVGLAQILKQTGLTASTSESMRMIGCIKRMRDGFYGRGWLYIVGTSNDAYCRWIKTNMSRSIEEIL